MVNRYLNGKNIFPANPFHRIAFSDSGLFNGFSILAFSSSL